MKGPRDHLWAQITTAIRSDEYRWLLIGRDRQVDPDHYQVRSWTG